MLYTPNILKCLKDLECHIYMAYFESGLELGLTSQLAEHTYLQRSITETAAPVPSPARGSTEPDSDHPLPCQALAPNNYTSNTHAPFTSQPNLTASGSASSLRHSPTGQPLHFSFTALASIYNHKCTKGLNRED